jgi:drug/metabolite transporter (DMT)-like permease
LPPGSSRYVERVFARPYLLLLLTCVFWGGNVVAALVLTARRAFIADWPRLAPHWKRLVLMGLFGFTGYHTLYYVSAHYTAGLHIAILQGVTPVLVFIGAWLLWRTPVRIAQAFGCLLTLVGVALVGAQGDFGQLAAMQFNIGDIGMLVASVFYGGYTLSLRFKPAASAMGFFVALAFVALTTSLPLLAYEFSIGQTIMPSMKGLVILVYVAIFPTLLAQVFFIRAVELIGPGRATLFYNLTPAIGAVFSTVFLREPFEMYHAIALILVIGGVLMAERLGR